MNTNDVKEFLENNYAEYLESVSDLSRSDNGKILVEDERKLYNFDKITKKIYPQNSPESADALYASDNKIFFVEYKSGFSKKINKKNFDPKKMTCYDNDEKYCEAYARLFLKNQKNEDKILKHSIHFKAVESYMTYMQEIASKCGKELDKVLYCVVVDDYVDNMEDILNSLAAKKSDTNIREELRQSLSRFRKRKKKSYYYDDIKVFSPYEFKKFLTQNM